MISIIHKNKEWRVKKKPEISITDKFEQLSREKDQSQYILKLFIAGNTSQSAQAIINIREICESRLKGRYTLEVIDIHQQTQLAKDEQIIAVPTLIKYLPLPLKKIIGDLSKTERVLVGLNLVEVQPTSESKD
jgi:circadian clock protein KaiB